MSDDNCCDNSDNNSDSRASNTGIKSILWINPIGVGDYDFPIAEYIHTIKQQDVAVEVVSLALSPTPHHLEYRTYEALVAGDIIKATRYGAENHFDAIVIGCFYDPSLEAAREISGSSVVVAPCQASLQLAEHLSNKFSIIVGQAKWIEQMSERVSAYGCDSKLASMRSIDISVPELQRDCRLTEDRIILAGKRAIEEDGAEALVLGCTCTFGLYERVQQELGVPVIDPICAAYKWAETMVELKHRFDWSPSRQGSMAPPDEQELKSFGLFQTQDLVGHRVVI
ncbi:aspartate/glutamate racemase family protein [Pseudomaricurvus alkylphenolicus]|uniref:aspartate/glutamate racemase family protein n=1 Tax=Pseudomaricurvus alkylphenolicus TaxID=1306991 RepID=UPI001981AD00|nr:aspartate/glutamate racemase family protein [Pseudomaricurvus alkylphenolicus]